MNLIQIVAFYFMLALELKANGHFWLFDKRRFSPDTIDLNNPMNQTLYHLSCCHCSNVDYFVLKALKLIIQCK